MRIRRIHTHTRAHNKNTLLSAEIMRLMEPLTSFCFCVFLTSPSLLLFSRFAVIVLMFAFALNCLQCIFRFLIEETLKDRQFVWIAVDRLDFFYVRHFIRFTHAPCTHLYSHRPIKVHILSRPLLLKFNHNKCVIIIIADLWHECVLVFVCCHCLSWCVRSFWLPLAEHTVYQKYAPAA